MLSGEQHHDHYVTYIRMIRLILKKFSNLRIIVKFIAGTRLMVKDSDTHDINSIHPTIELLSDERYQDKVQCYIVTEKRFPYHTLFCTEANIGLAELPHKETEPAISWVFNNNGYDEYIESWYEKIKEEYKAVELKFNDGNLYYGEEQIVESNKNKLFFIEKDYRKENRSHSSLKEEVEFHRSNLKMPMNDWHPYSSSPLSMEDLAALAS